MQPLQCAHLLLLLALLAFCLPSGWAEDNSTMTNGAPDQSPLCGSPALLSLALGLAAFLLRLC